MTIPREDMQAVVDATRFDDRGLVPVVAQDIATGVVRMMAWANAEALFATAESGQATFFSRSRGKLWRKGETSGNTLTVRQVRIDCDGDLILFAVDARGPSCHEGPTSCLFRSPKEGALVPDDGPAGPPSAILERVAAVIASRRGQDPGTSYVASLLAKGLPKISGKITEEAGELVEALPAGDAKHTAHEAADLVFHTLVGLEAAGVPVGDVFAELERRFGVSGHAEKASRNEGGK